MLICHRVELRQRLENLKYPQKLNTLGDHIRKRRLSLGLLQKQLAKRIGVNVTTLWNWESNTAQPQIHQYPKIVKLLGYNPSPAPENLSERLLVARKTRGWSRRKAAKVLGLDDGTLARLERGTRRRLFQKTLNKLAAFIGSEPRAR